MRRNVMLLQGPIGPFFARFAEELEARGFRVLKINFNGGDAFFYRRSGVIDYTDGPDEWEAWLERLLINRDIGRIYLFGDCRAHHRVARAVADRLGVRVFVFEEGYIRPNFVTLEENGVNGFSSLVSRRFTGEVADFQSAREKRRHKPSNASSSGSASGSSSQASVGLPSGSSPGTSSGSSSQPPRSSRGKEPEHGKARKLSDQLPDELDEPRHIFLFSALYSMAYYIACVVLRHRYPAYLHHRPLSVFGQGFHWVLSGLRKLRYRWRDRRMLRGLLRGYDGHYFLCPLQVHCDMQVIEHSTYNSIEHFIGDVLMSFARHAPSNKAIVFKHHPMDRAYTDYAMLFANLVAELGLQGRVFYVHDVCLPTLLKHAQGTVLINSTVGMSSLFHGTPVKTLGACIYGRQGLASQLPLRAFWRASESVDNCAFLQFRKHLIATNQVNGSLYRRLKGVGASGLQWPLSLLNEHSYDPNRQEGLASSALRKVGTPSASANQARDDDAAAA